MIRSPLPSLPSGAACEIATGLATLRPCARPALMQCPSCGKFACAAHRLDLDGQMRCTECYAGGEEAGTGDPGATGSSTAFGAADRKGLDRRKDDDASGASGRGGFGDS